MQVAKWGNSLAVRLPSAVVDALDLQPHGGELVGQRLYGRVGIEMVLEPGEGEFHDRASAAGNRPPQAQPDSPPPCGEGLGVGGTPNLGVLQSPPPCPSPTGGEGTL